MQGTGVGLRDCLILRSGNCRGTQNNLTAGLLSWLRPPRIDFVHNKRNFEVFDFSSWLFRVRRGHELGLLTNHELHKLDSLGGMSGITGDSERIASQGRYSRALPS